MKKVRGNIVIRVKKRTGKQLTKSKKKAFKIGQKQYQKRKLLPNSMEFMLQGFRFLHLRSRKKLEKRKKMYLKRLTKNKGLHSNIYTRFPKITRKFFTKTPIKKLLNPLTKWNKTQITTYDKLFYYYTVKTPMSLYAHKCFILLEMQLNASLVRMKLVPYLFQVEDLCFYRIVHLNGISVNSPYHILSLYDTVSIPVSLYNYMYYRNYRVQHYPRLLAKFFKQYWMQFTNYNQNKIWLLSNFLISNITAEAIIFDYPNIISYMAPFRRFTNLYYRNQPYTDTTQGGIELAYTHTIIKLKLFTYASFYK